MNVLQVAFVIINMMRGDAMCVVVVIEALCMCCICQIGMMTESLLQYD